MKEIKGLLILMPEVVWGGAERQFNYLINNSSAEYIRIICPHTYGGNIVGEKAFNGRNIGIVESESPVRGKLASILYYFREISKAVKERNYTAAIVYEAYSCYLIPYLKKKGVKVIYSERNSGEGIIQSRLLKKCVIKADFITTNSEEAKATLQNYFLQPIMCIKNGIRYAEAYRKKKLTTTIIVPARIAKVKNQIIVLKFLRDCPDFRGTVIFAGKVDDAEYLVSLQEFVKISGLTERVSFAGYVSDMENLYKLADLVILPSYVEGMSNTILECFMRKIPIIVSNIKMNIFTPNLMKWSFSPDSSEELVELFKKWIILSESEKDKVLCSNRDYVLQEHSIKKMTGCYEQLMGKENWGDEDTLV